MLGQICMVAPPPRTCFFVCSSIQFQFSSIHLMVRKSVDLFNMTNYNNTYYFLDSGKRVTDVTLGCVSVFVSLKRFKFILHFSASSPSFMISISWVLFRFFKRFNSLSSSKKRFKLFSPSRRSTSNYSPSSASSSHFFRALYILISYTIDISFLPPRTNASLSKEGQVMTCLFKSENVRVVSHAII